MEWNGLSNDGKIFKSKSAFAELTVSESHIDQKCIKLVGKLSEEETYQ